MIIFLHRITLLTYSDRLDGKGIFRQGLASIRAKLEERYYTSIAGFSAHLANVFSSEIGVQPAGDTAELQAQMGGRAPELSLEQREKRKLAKRIIKAIQPSLEEAIKNESDLNRKPFEKELNDLDLLLEGSLQSHGDIDHLDEPEEPNESNQRANGDVAETKLENPEEPAAPVSEKPDDSMPDGPIETGEPSEQPQELIPESTAESQPTDAPAPTAEGETVVNGEAGQESTTPRATSRPPSAPLTPPLSSEEDLGGGIQWYMQPFDPVGTTIHEERWTGRDVMRGMSEELSELDEDELMDLVDDELEQPKDSSKGEEEGPTGPPAEPEVKVHQTRTRRWRGFK